MTTRRIFSIGAIAGFLWITQGCGLEHKAHPEWNAVPSAQQDSTHTAPAQPGPNGRKVDQMDANADTVEALRRKAESYTSAMSPLILARPGTQPPPSPSAVLWRDPMSDFNLSAQAPGLAANQSNDLSSQPIQIAQATPRAEMARASDPSGAGTQTALALDQANETSKTAIASASGSSDLLPRAAARSKTPTASSAGDPLSDQLSLRVKDYPRDVAAHLDYQLLQFLKEEPTPDLADLSTLPPEDREMLTAILDGLNNFRNSMRADSNMLFSSKIRPIIDAAERLRTQADLTIPTIRLCTRVTTYGVYDPIEPAKFPAGKDQQVIVYCEVANFASSMNDNQMWQTHLTWDKTLYSEQGMSVWSDKTEPVNDESRNRRHDFFVRKVITIPHTLPIGRYLLKVTIVDSQSNHVAEATTPLVVVAE